MDGVEQIVEANTRLSRALRELNRFDFNRFTEDEIRFRVETIANAIIIVQNDLLTMKREWDNALAGRNKSTKGRQEMDNVQAKNYLNECYRLLKEADARGIKDQPTAFSIGTLIIAIDLLAAVVENLANSHRLTKHVPEDDIPF